MCTTPDWPVRDLLSHRVAATPEATAVVDAADGRTWTYRDLDRLVDAATDRLRSQLGPNDDTGPTERPCVVIAASTDVEFVVALFAAWRAGALVAPVDATGPADELDRRLSRLGADTLVGDWDRRTWTGGDGDRRVISLEGKIGAESDPSGESETGRDGRSDPPATWNPREPALVLFTSGTTGEPKGVALCHRNLVASASGSASRLGLDPAERWLDCLPTNHMGGLAPIVRSTCYGTAVVLQRSFDSRETAEAFADHDVTAVSMVPTQLRRLLADGWTPPSSLRFVLLGGAPAGRDLLADAAAAGVPVCPTYGTTETASQIATAAPGEADGETDTVGSPMVAATVTIVDPEEGRPVDAGETGELVVDGPIVTPGYLDDGATETAFGEFGLHTGDLASRDGAGRLAIHGRLDDAIQTGGETVHPWRVAAVLRGLPELEDAAVVDVPDPEWGERVAALVVPAGGATDGPNADVDEGTVRAACEADLADYEVPKTVRAVDALPRTDSGTIDREAVRDLLAAATDG